MNPQSLLARLQDSSEGGPLDRLAELTVEHALEQPLAAHLVPGGLARALVSSLEGWLASESAERELAIATTRIREALTRDTRSLREALPPEAAKGLAELVARRYSPDRRVVLAVLDRPPVRALVRGLLLEVLVEFSRKVSAPVTESRVARGLGGLARMAAEQARSSSGAIGSLASGMVGAFSEELERQVERRARDFADSALSQVMQRAADALCDPTRSAEQAEMRVALLEGVLGLKLSQVGRELERMDVAQSAAALREALARWLASGSAPAELERLFARLLERDGQRPLREVLEPLGLLEPARTLGREVLRVRMAPVVASAPFARWLEELLRSAEGSP